MRQKSQVWIANLLSKCQYIQSLPGVLWVEVELGTETELECSRPSSPESSLVTFAKATLAPLTKLLPFS